MRTRTHARTPAHRAYASQPPQAHTNAHPHTHRHMRTLTRAHARTRARTHIRKRAHERTHMQTLTHIHAYAPSHARTRVSTHAHTCTRPRTHRHPNTSARKYSRPHPQAHTRAPTGACTHIHAHAEIARTWAPLHARTLVVRTHLYARAPRAQARILVRTYLCMYMCMVNWGMTAPGGKTAPSCRQFEATPHIYRIYRMVLPSAGYLFRKQHA